MKTRFLFTLGLVAVASVRAANVGSPQWLVETFFTQAALPETEKYYVGEMRHYLQTPAMGHFAKPGYQLTKRILQDEENAMVWAVCYDYPEPTPDRDWYAFLVREDGSWKLSAVRALALPGLFYNLLQQLHDKPERTETEDWTMREMDLTVLSDVDLKSYFRNHRDVFQSVANAVISLPARTIIHGEKSEGVKDSQQSIWTTIHELHLNFARHADQGWVDSNIGGILDNAVGYLFVPAGIDPPHMHAENFILIDPLGDGWYLYKTT